MSSRAEPGSSPPATTGGATGQAELSPSSSRERPRPLDDEPQSQRARVVWSPEARRKLLPRRGPDRLPSPDVYKRGLLAELADLGKRSAVDPSRPPASSRASNDWHHLRKVLAAADEDTYAEAKTLAARMREGAPIRLRCASAYAFATETSWSRDDAAACVDLAREGKPLPPNAQWLFASIADPELAVDLIRAFPPGQPRVDLAAYAFELVESMGAEAASALMLLFDEAKASKEWSIELAQCLRALELIQSEEVASAFARHLDRSDVRPYAARYFKAAPRLAVKALAPLAAARGRAAEAAKTLLLAVVASSPSVASAILPDLGGAARRGVLSALEISERPYEEASIDELPPILVRPPWRDKGARRPRIIEDLRIRDERMTGDGGLDPTNRSSPAFTSEKPPASVRDAWATRLHWVPNSLVFSPRVALLVVDAWIHRPEDRAAADAWLMAFPETAAAGLIPAAVGNAGSLRLEAGRMLRLLVARGAGDAVRAAAARYGDEVATIIDDVLALDALLDCPESPPKLPDFLRIEALPRPRFRGVWGGSPACPGGPPIVLPSAAPPVSGPPSSPTPIKALSAEATRNLCEMLAFSSEDFPYAGIEIVRASCDKASLADFAWAIVAAWLASGGPMKYSWPLRALAALGGDEGARRLAPEIRRWADERKDLQAQAGVDALARIGTDVALMRLSAFAQSPRFPELQRHARARIAAVAEERGLSPDELADRLVPDLDLDRDGSKLLEYGARTFRVGFDEHLEPFVRADSGAELVSLPRPTKADDPAKAAAAQAAWRGLRDDAGVAAKAQSYRLELAMASRRRWTPAEHRAFLIDHPFMVHLARRLVWGAFDAEGRLAMTFRVAEDRTLADERDAPCTVPEGFAIGLPHPLEVSPDALVNWGGVFADYGIVQPFEQIGRATFQPTEAERASTILRRFEGMRVATGKIFGVLERWGWRRETEMEGVVSLYSKELLASRRVVLLELEPGIRVKKSSETPEQTLGALSLMRDRSLSIRDPFGELDPIVFSELVRDIDRLRG